MRRRSNCVLALASGLAVGAAVATAGPASAEDAVVMNFGRCQASDEFRQEAPGQTQTGPLTIVLNPSKFRLNVPNAFTSAVGCG